MTSGQDPIQFAGIFSGIGGLEMAVEAHGGECLFMCESEPFCKRVLSRRFQGIPLFDDVHEVSRKRLVTEGVIEEEACIDLLVGGFP